MATILVASAAYTESAQADDLCVGAAPTCATSNTFATSAAGLQAALDASNAVTHPGPDRIFVAAGDYALGAPLALTAAQQLEVIGAGASQTRFNFSGAGALDLTLPNAASRVSGIAFDQSAAAAAGGWGLRIAGGEVDHVAIRGATSGFTAFTATGISTLSNSLIDIGPVAGAVGLDAHRDSGQTRSVGLEVDHLTLAGGGVGQRAVSTWVASDVPSSTTTHVTIRNSLLYLTGLYSLDFYCPRGNAASQVTLSADHSAFDPRSYLTPGTCPLQFTNTVDLSYRPLRLVNPAGGDYHPRYNSALVDAAAGAPTPGATDLDGNQRFVDGNDDGVAAADIGAYEYQLIPPVVHVVAPAVGSLIGNPVKLSASAFDPQGEWIHYRWVIDNGQQFFGQSNVTFTFRRAGNHYLRFIAQDITGATSVGYKIVRVLAPALMPFNAQTVYLSRSGHGFRQTAHISKSAVSFISQAATRVKVTLQRRHHGHFGGPHCVVGHHDRHCHRYIKIRGKAILRVRDGRHWFRFGARFDHRTLPRGVYRMKLTPIAANHWRGTAVAIRIRIR